MYFEALYNESRNAIPSWQGYNYQGEVAAYKYLYYLLKQFRNKSDNINSIFIKIEWLEDFVLFEEKSIKEIYQVKKTLTERDYQEVMQNFILQFKLHKDESCKWFVIYDEVTNEELDKITEDRFNEIYDLYINKVVLVELNLLADKRNELSFWKEELKLRNSKSKLPTIRGFIRKLMSQESLDFYKLTIRDCNDFTDSHLVNIRSELVLNADDFLNFEKKVNFMEVKIASLKSLSIGIIHKLNTESFINKSDIMQAEDIFNLLYVMLYEKLMKIKNKKDDELLINYDDIQKIFMCTDRDISIWKAQVYKAREEMSNKISDYCVKCEIKECDECQVTSFLKLDFCELIDHCNLEHPRIEPGTIGVSLMNKLSREKNTHLTKTLLKHRENINCIKHSNFVELNINNMKLFVSENITDDHDENRLELINNMKNHLAVYKEYNHVLTKNFDDVIDYDKAKIVMNTEFVTEKTPPTFMQVLPVTFVSKKVLEEE